MTMEKIIKETKKFFIERGFNIDDNIDNLTPSKTKEAYLKYLSTGQSEIDFLKEEFGPFENYLKYIAAHIATYIQDQTQINLKDKEVQKYVSNLTFIVLGASKNTKNQSRN